MTLLRIWSWIFIFASPFLIALYLFIEEQFKPPAPSCNHMACVGKGIGEFFLVVFVYAAFLLVGIIINLIDFIRTRRTASVWRKIEIFVFTAPIWLWVFAIPGVIQDMFEQKKIDALAPYAEVIDNHETANYDQLLIAIKMVNDAAHEIKNYFPNLNINLDYAHRKIDQINFINQNKQRKLPSDFSLNHFIFCIKDIGLEVPNERWRLNFYKKDEFNELDALSDTEILISGETDNQGCSKVTDTLLLTSAIKNGKTLFLVVNSRVIFLDVELSNRTITSYNQLSSGFEIDAQPLP